MTAAALGALGGVAGLLAVTVLLRRRLLFVTVAGLSMQPTLDHGDRVLVRRVPLDAVRAGQLVVLAEPVDGDPGGGTGALMVKRAVAVPGDPAPRATFAALAATADPVVPAGRLVVKGDNARLSRDSRHLGYLPGTALVGVVVRRWPLRSPAAPVAAGQPPAGRRRIASEGGTG
ncbi:S26 family signal peptidase [Dactylosporangium sp. CA-139066]|uniref:S26 family signal peptidase n=1 Tax=Dactylosporangium sp. CA-139066 TaxID=3239930 RepID=UPI003D9327E6